MVTLMRWIVVVVMLASLPGCALFDFAHRYQAISEPPTQGGVAAPMPVQASSLQPVVHVPLASIESAANIAASTVLPIHGQGRERIGEWRVEAWPFGCVLCVALDVDWQYDAGLTGPIRVTGGSNLLGITLPFRVSGKAGLNGDIAKILSLNGKNIVAAADISFQSGFAPDLRFCPRVKSVSLKYAWTEGPSVQIIGKNCLGNLCVGPWNYNVDHYIDPELRAAIPKLTQGLDQNLPCEPVRGELAKIWSTRSFPITVPYEKLFVNLTPTALYIPEVQVDTQRLSVMGRLDAMVSVDNQPIAEKPLALPSNTPAPITPGLFSFAIPVSTRYYTLEALAKGQLLGRTFSASTPLGGIAVRPKSIRIFPSGESVAIGVGFVLDYQYKIFNTSGTVWFSARPVVENGKVLRLADIRITRRFDNPIWAVASFLLEDRVQGAISNGIVIDLTQTLTNAEQQVTASLNGASQGQGFDINAHDVSIGIGRILTADPALQVEGLFRATVDVTMTAPVR